MALPSTSSYAGQLRQDHHSDAEINFVEPVFLKCADLPGDETTTHELCMLGEKVAGYKSMVCAQRIGGLWRLYPESRDARALLLASGLSINGVSVPLANKNPFTLLNSGGEELPSTRITISGVPLSCSNLDIEQAIEAQGVTLLSRAKHERARDKNNKLTRFLTGRRFMHTSIPTVPLPRKMKIGVFTAEIYHREQRAAALLATRECYKCFEVGHLAAACENPVKCKDCRQEGHKSGDPHCPWLEQALMHENRIRSEDEFPSITTDANEAINDHEGDGETLLKEQAGSQSAAASTTPEPKDAGKNTGAGKGSAPKKPVNGLRMFTFRKAADKKRGREPEAECDNNEGDSSSSKLKKSAVAADNT